MGSPLKEGKVRLEVDKDYSKMQQIKREGSIEGEGGLY